MLRTANTPLRAVWASMYWSITRATLIYLRRKHPGASIYLKGSFAAGEPVYGVSDIDLVAVLPTDGSNLASLQLSARENWKNFARRVTTFRSAIQHCWFYEENDLEKSLSEPCLTYGLARADDEQSDDRAGFLGANALHDHMGLQTHPSLYGASVEWRRLDGTDRLPPKRADDEQSRRVAAWLDLQYWWRHAFLACRDPAPAHIPLLCVKLIAEPVRLWLWLERGERVGTREAALQRGLAELPEERELIQSALDLQKALPRSPRPPMLEVIAGLVRLSERLAAHMQLAAATAGSVDVRLTGGKDLVSTSIPEAVSRHSGARGAVGHALPLADWRACAVPGIPDETFALIAPGEITPDILRATALAGDKEINPAIRYNSIMLFPTTDPERAILRSIQCEPTDPVSLALSNGQAVARFPRLDGWSALHCARRAVAEHRGWLASAGVISPPHGWIGTQIGCRVATTRSMGLLFTAARAALFLESISDGDPALALTTEAVADRLIARDSSCREIVETSLQDFRDSREARRHEVRSITALCDVVSNLSAYSEPPALSTIPR
jgi:nucleotidyltransferase-like protein